MPDANAKYVTINLHGWRGLYGSAWMDGSTAILSAILVSLGGFFLVRGAVGRDERFAFRSIVAATPTRSTRLILGKWISDVAFLVAVAFVVLSAAVAMQELRGEDRHINVMDYLNPFAIVTIPTCLITASIAIVFDVVRFFRGIVGGVVYFFLWTAIVCASVIGPLATPYGFDPLGIAAVLAAMVDNLNAAGIPTSQSDVSVGVIPAAHLKLLRWSSFTVSLPRHSLEQVGAFCRLLLFAVLRSRSIGARSDRRRGVYSHCRCTESFRRSPPLPSFERKW